MADQFAQDPDSRAEFEADAEPMGFDLTRISLPVPEPWSEYADENTGHRWGGWLAATQRQQERIAELEAQVQALTREAVVLAEKAETHDAINRACAELPEGYDLHIELEKNAGTVRLYLLDSDADVTDFGSDLGFVGEINAAIDAAIAAGKGEG